jgi:uncharacterized protein (TIGR02266 family)
MDPRVIPPPGTPAAELARLCDEERQLADRENEMLTQGAAAEGRAREVQSQLDGARAALQRLSGTSVRSDAEKAFLDSLSFVVPPHVASAETSRALDLRRKALIARLQAIEAEGGAVRGRAARLEELSQAIASLQIQAAALVERARAPQPAPIPLTPAPRPAQPAPIPLTPAARPAAAPIPLTPSARQAAKAAPRPAPAEPSMDDWPPASDTDWPPPEAAAAPPRAPAPPAKAKAPAAATVPARRVAPAAPTPLVPQVKPATPAKAPAPQPKPAPAARAPADPIPAPAPAPAKAGAAVENSRGASRVRLQTEVTLGSESNFYTGFSGNLSEGGLFVATYEKLLPAGTRVEVAVTLPDRPALKLPGTVRWVRDPSDHTPGVFPGMGIAFDDVPSDALKAIKSFLSQREPMFWED